MISYQTHVWQTTSAIFDLMLVFPLTSIEIEIIKVLVKDLSPEIILNKHCPKEVFNFLNSQNVLHNTRKNYERNEFDTS